MKAPHLQITCPSCGKTVAGTHFDSIKTLRTANHKDSKSKEWCIGGYVPTAEGK